MKKIIINHSVEASVVSAGFHLENFPWGGSSLGSSCYVCTNVVPSLACAAMTSLACRESACAYDLILVVISLGGKLPPCPPSPPPQYVDETLVNPSAYVAMDEEQNKPIIGTIKTRDITAAMAEQ